MPLKFRDKFHGCSITTIEFTGWRMEVGLLRPKKPVWKHIIGKWIEYSCIYLTGALGIHWKLLQQLYTTIITKLMGRTKIPKPIHFKIIQMFNWIKKIMRNSGCGSRSKKNQQKRRHKTQTDTLFKMRKDNIYSLQSTSSNEKWSK